LRNDTESPASNSESDSSGDAAPDSVVDWLGQNPLAAQGITWPLPDCLDCNSTPRSQFTHPLFFEIVSGGGSGGGGGSESTPGTDALPPVIVTDFAPPTDKGNGPGDQGGPSTSDGPSPSNPRDRPTSDPTDPNEPDPQPTDVLQVPEPSTLIMAGAGALGFMIRGRLTRKRRD
jgi:hypothetical protein